jgi:hypothetical protein
MAEYVTYFITTGNYDGDVFSPATGSTAADGTLSNQEAGEVFTSGDTLSGTVDGEPTSGEYIGFYTDGIVVLVDGVYWFLSTSELASNDAFAVNANAPFVTCFLAGTAIATARGDVAVEELAAGDHVLDPEGRALAVKWIGRQTVVTIFGPAEQNWPVVIEKGALGPEQPRRDLRVTPDHAFLLDGVLVQAGALVNGTTVRRLKPGDLGERYTVFHIELDDHALVLAEGVPAETYVDNVTRRRFDNYAEYAALHGDVSAVIAEMEVPRVKAARQLPRAVRERLEARVAAVATVRASAA